ncbi:MAG: hypothetical protein ABIK82_19050 [Pseudomonadota bacterium]
MHGHTLRTLGACLILILFCGVAQAQVVAVETSTETVGATTITWESNFEDLNYTVGDPILMTVSWTVDAGTATYNETVFRHYTPKSKNSPADGDEPTFTYPGSAGENSVDIAFTFTELHSGKKASVAIGNGHFTIKLDADEDGDGEVDTIACLGTNIHVEDPVDEVE